MRRLRLSLTLLCLVAFVSSLPVYAQREKLSSEDLTIVNQKWPDAKRTVTGLRYVMHEIGLGDPVRTGDVVSVYYKASLLDGTVFNSCLPPDEAFTFRIDRGLVIEAWDQALKLMRERGKMTLIVPYELGYGTRGNPPRVPRQATLVFEIELLKIYRGVPAASHFPPPPEDKKKK
jgi:FKBP-type peptidyl-prolyl cis-trans isomerase